MSVLPTHDRAHTWPRPVPVSTLSGPPTTCLGPECNGLIVGFASGTWHASCPKARYGGVAHDITAWMQTEARVGRTQARETASAVGVYGPYDQRVIARAYLAYTTEHEERSIAGPFPEQRSDVSAFEWQEVRS